MNVFRGREEEKDSRTNIKVLAYQIFFTKEC